MRGGPHAPPHALCPASRWPRHRWPWPISEEPNPQPSASTRYQSPKWLKVRALVLKENNYTYQIWESLRAGARERQVSLTLQWITSWNDKTVVLT